jgi:DNA polymerase
VKGLFGEDVPGITKLRGTWMSFDGIDVMPTLHPSYVLRNGGDHGEHNKEVFMQVWSDLTAALKKIGREPPPKAK